MDTGAPCAVPIAPYRPKKAVGPSFAGGSDPSSSQKDAGALRRSSRLAVASASAVARSPSPVFAPASSPAPSPSLPSPPQWAHSPTATPPPSAQPATTFTLISAPTAAPAPAPAPFPANILAPIPVPQPSIVTPLPRVRLLLPQKQKWEEEPDVPVAKKARRTKRNQSAHEAENVASTSTANEPAPAPAEEDGGEDDEVPEDEMEPTCQCSVEDPPEYEGGEPVASLCGASFPRDSDEWSDHFKSHFGDDFNSQARVECPWCGVEHVQIIRHMLGHLEILYKCRYGCPETFTRIDAEGRHANGSCPIGSEYLP